MTTQRSSSTFSAATEEFLAAADWLTPLDAPAVASLRLIARQLDTELTAALVAQHGVTYRALMRSRPATPAPADPVADAIGDLRAAP